MRDRTEKFDHARSRTTKFDDIDFSRPVASWVEPVDPFEPSDSVAYGGVAPNQRAD
jgi:hypothetical protein